MSEPYKFMGSDINLTLGSGLLSTVHLIVSLAR